MAHKILLIDDDRINTTLIKFALASQNYEVVYAEDGAQGLAMVREETPDLIILDVYMPNMDGFQFVEELKAIQGFRTTPILVVTSNETMEDIFKLEGVKGYFVKPVSADDLIAKIVACIGENPIE